MTMGIRRNKSGNAAAEFAIVVPVMLTIFAGVADLGGVLLTRFRLDEASAAAAAYALTQASNVGSANGTTLAQNIATLARDDNGTSSNQVTVSVNNGPTAQTDSGYNVSTGGTPSAADSCYCPTSTPFAFGAAAASCTTTCADGSRAGKFVKITVSRNYTPMFSSYGIVSNGTISVTTVVQAS
jgi:Flp pilus assembly protein TadG